jgi:hypothetical protein
MPRERDEACRLCDYFRNDPAYLEAVLNGFTGLGSAYAATRADDGLCQSHDRFAGPHGWCEDFHRRDDRA